MRRRLVELGRVGAGETGDVAGVLDDGALQAETQPEEGNALLPGDADRLYLALDAADAEATRHADAVEGADKLGAAGGEVAGDDAASGPVERRAVAVLVGRDPDDLDLRVGGVPA